MKSKAHNLGIWLDFSVPSYVGSFHGCIMKSFCEISSPSTSVDSPIPYASKELTHNYSSVSTVTTVDGRFSSGCLTGCESTGQWGGCCHHWLVCTSAGERTSVGPWLTTRPLHLSLTLWLSTSCFLLQLFVNARGQVTVNKIIAVGKASFRSELAPFSCRVSLSAVLSGWPGFLLWWFEWGCPPWAQTLEYLVPSWFGEVQPSWRDDVTVSGLWEFKAPLGFQCSLCCG